MEVHIFSIAVRQDGALYTGEQIGNLKTLKWLACGALVAESDILEILGSHPSSNGPEWEPRFARNKSWSYIL